MRRLCFLYLFAIISAMALPQSASGTALRIAASSEHLKNVTHQRRQPGAARGATYYFNRGWARINGSADLADTFFSPDGQSMNPVPDDFQFTPGIVHCVYHACTLADMWELVHFTPPGNIYQTGSGSIDATSQNTTVTGGELTVTGSATGSAWFLPCEWYLGNCIETGDTYILNAQFSYIAHFTGGPDEWLLQDVYVTSQNPVPYISQPLVPTAITPGGSSFALTINGTGFVPGTVVNWNGNPRPTTVVNGSQIAATISATDIVTATTASITAVNPSPGGGVSNAVFFTVTPPTSSVSMSESVIASAANPYAITVGDFNADGKLDLATANGSGSFSVYLGNGDGTFAAAANYDIGQDVRSIVVGDFDGDGKLDLAVGSVSSKIVCILLGKGDGTFQPCLNSSISGSALGLATGDFNGDGKLDLATTNTPNNTVSILLGNGDGTFQPRTDYATGAWATSVATGDLNGDGKLDLAVANNTSPYVVSILLGNGDGTFRPHVDYSGVASYSVSVADFNRDGKLDLALIGAASNTVSIYLGNGDGTFQSPINTPYPNPGGTQKIFSATGDFNGDGKLDLAVSGSGPPILMLLGAGNGTFPSILVVANSPYYYEGIAVGDFNGGGRLDLAATNFGSPSTVSVLLQATATTTGLTSSLNPSRYGQTVILTAAVAPNGSGTPNGTITFSDGTTTLASVPLSNGTATLTISTLAGGSHSLTAVYSGDGIFATSTSPTLIQVVAKSSVGITLISSLNPAYVNQLVTFSADMSGSPTTPTGSVTFKKGTSVLATVPLANGQANLTTTFTKAGSFSIIASYSGDQNYLAKNSKAVKQVVSKYTTSTALTSQPNPSTHGQPVTLTAVVSSVGPLPTGKVVFKNGSTSLGSGSLVNGVATITKSNLPLGTLSIVATFNGDAESTKSTSPPLMQIVN